MQKYWQINVIVIFLWLGFVCAISFMEAWLKFQAPGITLPLGLGIGRLVFHTLNKVEWIFALSILATTLLNKIKNTTILITFGIVLCILIIQTFYLLPELDDRASIVISGKTCAPSNVHFIYIFIESLKVITLFTLGFKMFPPSFE